MNFTNSLLLIMTLSLSAAVPLQAVASGEDHHEHAETEQRGPHGGKLLSEDELAVEITIYESGIPPEMRVYTYQNGELINPANVDLDVTLNRLGGQTDVLSFLPEGDYLVSNEVITEPHSYEVSVEVAVDSDSADWHYESFEGRATLSDRVLEKAGITTEQATSQTLVFTDTLFGVIAPVNDQIAHVRATYKGEVAEVRVAIGDQVKQGDTMAVIINAASGTRYSLMSPIAGEITERFINQGEIAADQVLFEVADLAQVWVELSAFPENIERLQVGQETQVFDLHQHLRASGQITYIAPVMTGGHIARARAQIDNPQGHWRPGMHVKADVITDKKQVPLAVKKDAIQTFRDMPVVFARYGNTFEVRMVDLGQSDGNYVEVTGGLTPNTPYVISNSYLLKADVLKEGASHDH